MVALYESGLKMQTFHERKISSKITAGSFYDVKCGKVAEEPQKNGKESF